MRKSARLDTAVSDEAKIAFDFFNELSILQQLSRARLERRLPDGINYSHFSVLSHLTRTTDGKSPLELAKILQVSKGTMTHTLTGLAERGLIAMRPHPRDGRSKLVYLTKTGRRLRENADRQIAPEVAMMAERFDFSALAPLLPVLAELRDKMDRYRDED